MATGNKSRPLFQWLERISIIAANASGPIDLRIGARTKLEIHRLLQASTRARLVGFSIRLRRPSYLRCALVVVAVAALYPVPSTTRAQEADIISAERHFAQGVELYQEGGLDSALVEFERAYELVADYRLLFNIAQVEAERHQYVRAIDLFERYLKEGREEISAERQQRVHSEISTLRGRIAEVTVDADVPSAILYLNDVKAAHLPIATPLRVNSGFSHLRVEAIGYEAQERTIKVAGGERITVSFTLRSTTEAQTRVRASNPQRKTSLDPYSPADYTPFWITASGAAALGVTAGVLGYLTLRADRRLEGKLDKFNPDRAAIDDQRSKVRNLGIFTDGFLAASLVTTGLSLYFLLDPPEEAADEKPSSKLRARVVPHPTGAAIVGSF